MVVGVGLAAVPTVRMALLIRSGSPMQYGDYWTMAGEVFELDGGLDIGGLFQFRNEHPVVAAKVLYWLNYRLTGGSNIALGYAVVVVVLLQLALLAAMARSGVLTRTRQVALVVAASALLFAPFGAWNFVKSMSGAAWLTANLFAIAALWLRLRHGRYSALPLGVLATMSYGTGLAVWPALIVAGWAQDRRLRPQWPVALTATVATAWYLAVYLGTDSSHNSRSSGLTVIKNASRITGSILAPDNLDVATGLGALALVALAGSAVVAARRHGAEASAWLGLAALGVASTALISIGRDYGAGSLIRSRYSSPAALVWIALLALVLLNVAGRPRSAVRPNLANLAVVLVVVVALAATFAGDREVQSLIDGTEEQELLAVAMHLDLADGARRWTGYVPFPPVTDLLRTLDHHPFDGRWNADCGQLGEVIDGDLIDMSASSDAGVVSAVRPTSSISEATELVGWVRADATIDCVVVLDPMDRVVGAAIVLDEEASDRPSAFRALTPAGAPSNSVAVHHEGSKRFERLSVQIGARRP